MHTNTKRITEGRKQSKTRTEKCNTGKWDKTRGWRVKT